MKSKKITQREYGENYPYTIDNLTLKVAENYPNAIYVEDESGNKFAVNGNGCVYLTQIKKDKKFIGYTTEILKSGETDTLILLEGFRIYSNYQYLRHLKIFCFCYLVLFAITVLSLFVALNCKALNWLAWISFGYCLVNFIQASIKCYKLWRVK